MQIKPIIWPLSLAQQLGCGSNPSASCVTGSYPSAIPITATSPTGLPSGDHCTTSPLNIPYPYPRILVLRHFSIMPSSAAKAREVSFGFEGRPEAPGPYSEPDCSTNAALRPVVPCLSRIYDRSDRRSLALRTDWKASRLSMLLPSNKHRVPKIQNAVCHFQLLAQPRSARTL